MLKHSHYYQIQGFTMIELVMVIVIIGILAAAALPRFANLTDQAEVASNQATAGALRSAVGVAHSAWIAAGANSSGSSTVTLDTQGVTMNVRGWPNGNALSIANISAIECQTIFTQSLVNPPTNSIVSTTFTDSPAYFISGAPVSSQGICTYTQYTNGSATGKTIVYNHATGSVTVN